MNKRQKKKAFKKKHGINPKVMTLECEIDWTEAVKAILELGNRAKDTLDYIAKAIIPQWGLTLQELADEHKQNGGHCFGKSVNTVDCCKQRGQLSN